ncbi:hypothetical protein BCR34DRAFT_223427 [Clohesyomyces aquaticus]|uniref:Uncharacterized protein n=1 Tax=Clohesyomyces aquaticus TaxID=1231657 RepID=A0A1Y1ZWR0_9PLEO|nr:hypothetical protein BCR34DRAFT_223427 [Clohesyomyces aquaticus]
MNGWVLWHHMPRDSLYLPLVLICNHGSTFACKTCVGWCAPSPSGVRLHTPVIPGCSCTLLLRPFKRPCILLAQPLFTPLWVLLIQIKHLHVPRETDPLKRLSAGRGIKPTPPPIHPRYSARGCCAIHRP